MTDEDLKARLPDPVAARVQSLRSDGGKVTAILDASGLDARQRDGLETAVVDLLGATEGVSEVRVAMTADKPQRRIVAVGSGKGGVGKSTLTANLAVAMARTGRRVGVVDADIYGPSQPKLLGTEGKRPEATEKTLFPVASDWGVPSLSIGHLVPAEKAIAWRGPMASGALGQLIEADWGQVDTLLVDLPPGTGDVQISMIQKYKPAGAVIVSTPQDIAMIDARRAMQLFGDVQVPVIGLVENMAGYACPHCGEISDPFGSGGVEAAARAIGVPFLGRVPLDRAILTASDAGTPPAAQDGPQGEAFRAIAAEVGRWLDGARG